MTHNDIIKYEPKNELNGKSNVLAQKKFFPKSLSINDIFENHITLDRPFSYFYYIFRYTDYYYIIPIHRDIFYSINSRNKDMSSAIIDIVILNGFDGQSETCFIYSHSVFFQEDNYKVNICREYFDPILFVEIISSIFYLAHESKWVFSEDFLYNKNNYQILTNNDLSSLETLVINHINKIQVKNIASFVNTHEYAFEFFRYFDEPIFSFPILGYLLGLRKDINSNFIINYFGINSGIINNAEHRKTNDSVYHNNHELHLQNRKPKKYSISYVYFHEMFSYIDINISHHLLINSSPKSNLDIQLYDKWFKIDNVYTLVIDRTGDTLEFCGFVSIDNEYDQEIYNYNIENIIFGEGLKFIGDNVLADSDIISIILPDSLISIGDDFCRSSNISNRIIFPIKLEEIGDKCLARTDIKEIVIKSRKLNIGKKFAQGCYKLYSFMMEKGELEFDDLFLTKCDSLETIILPDSLEYISNDFMSESNMSNFVIPEGVKKIGNNFGLYAIHPEKITLPSNLESIGDSFLFKTKIKKITIPASVMKIGNLFMSKSSLHKVYFDKDSMLHRIGNDFLCYSRELQKVKLGNNITDIGDRFMTHTELTEIILSKKLNNLGNSFMIDSKSLEYVRFHNLLYCTIGDNFMMDCPLAKIIYFKDRDFFNNQDINDVIRLYRIPANIELLHYDNQNTYKEVKKESLKKINYELEYNHKEYFDE